jgi:hypothetical protein
VTEHRCRYETDRENENVDRPEQDQRGAAEWRSCFHNKIIYTINELAMQ